MSGYKFSIAVNVDISQFLQQARQQLNAAGGNLEGDEHEGIVLVDTPMGIIFGIYTIAEDIVHISITRKPLLLNCDNIKELVIDALGLRIPDLSA